MRSPLAPILERSVAAVNYARGANAVCPGNPHVKEPLTSLAPRGVLDATSDPAVVADWWRKRPDANICLALAASKKVALDIDDPELARAVLAARPTLPQETWCQRTPRRGLHVVVGFEEGEPPRTRHLYDTRGRRLGELRSAGAYILAWPSRTAAGGHELLSPRFPWQEGAVKTFMTAEDAEAFLLSLL